jgi:hypothetical protein
MGRISNRKKMASAKNSKLQVNKNALGSFLQGVFVYYSNGNYTM